jgi:ribosomal protein L11 methyltransferase
MNKNKFLEISWELKSTQDDIDIIISYLADYGFDSFYEGENFLNAYIEKDKFNKNSFEETLFSIPISVNLDNYKLAEMPNINWNKEWESNFSPIVVDGDITIKAPFHKIEHKTKYLIEIEPKMSFGTGHHETTSGMLEVMKSVDFKSKSVIDMGSGTGILSVFAEMLGAKEIKAIDNDAVCIENSNEIFKLNKTKNITAFLGDCGLIRNMNADIILANINRNVLLSDVKYYVNSLKEQGILVMSGFYKEDFEMINNECVKNKLKHLTMIIKNNWVICTYQK